MNLTSPLLRYAILLLAALPITAMEVVDLLRAPDPAAIVYRTVGGVELKLWHVPAEGAKPGERRSAIMLIHGGAWKAGDAKVFFPHARYFAARGLVAFSVDYRLLTPDAVGMEVCLADCIAALRHIRSHALVLGVDDQRIAVMGDSAGGHLAGALGTVTGFDDPADDMTVRGTPDAMVLCNPIVDLTDPAWIAFVIRGRALERKPAPEALKPDEAQALLARRLSPLHQVKPGQAPTLLMHGLQDHVVDAEQARRFATAMQAARNRCDLELLPEAKHAFVVMRYSATEEAVVAALQRIDRFLASLGWLTGEPTLTVSREPAWTIKPRK